MSIDQISKRSWFIYQHFSPGLSFLIYLFLSVSFCSDSAFCSNLTSVSPHSSALPPLSFHALMNSFCCALNQWGSANDCRCLFCRSAGHYKTVYQEAKRIRCYYSIQLSIGILSRVSRVMWTSEDHKSPGSIDRVLRDSTIFIWTHFHLSFIELKWSIIDLSSGVYSFI